MAIRKKVVKKILEVGETAEPTKDIPQYEPEFKAKPEKVRMKPKFEQPGTNNQKREVIE
jgi:hypothetical protein